jgi:transcriptional repressor NrdR
MKCPFCDGHESMVTDSRDSGDGIHRRRRCKECGRKFSTYERVETAQLLVVKSDGRREPYDREKLYRGIRRACEKRPLPVGELENAVDEIEQALYRLGRPEVASQVIGEMVMEKLARMDSIAYIRFASVYRSFSDLEEMRQEMDELLRRSSQK